MTQQSAQQLILALTGRLSRAEQGGEASAALLRKVHTLWSHTACIEPVPMYSSLALSCSL